MNTYSVNAKDLIENVRILKEKAAEAKIIAVLKGNGYGLGARRLARILLDEGVTFFAANTLAEVREIIEIAGENADYEILFLRSSCIYEEVRELVELNVTLTLGSQNAVEIAEKAARESGGTVKAHLKIDTGFGRYGFLPTDKPNIPPNVNISGAYTHFSSAFALSPKRTIGQLRIFEETLKKWEISGVLTHVCNSSAFIKYGAMGHGAVRLGSAFLGRISVPNTLGLRRVGRLISRVAELKTLKKRANVGYANIFKTRRDTKIAIVPAGYSDGFGHVQLQNVAQFSDILRAVKRLLIPPKVHVEIGGNKREILGRINMCNIIVDVTDADVKIGDEVIIDCSPISNQASVDFQE
ncbi:MAG: alanine racemase [Clostridiales bacterium]|jgi:alanine racemase|nr:alanine racemase [Clostridiales bacterium]